MNAIQSHMLREAREAPEAVARFLDRNTPALGEIGRRLRGAPPPMVLTMARGSSDHAAFFFKYLTEILIGVPCASIGASVVSVYGARLKAENSVAITVSQSGKSPDILAAQEAAKRAGALTVALVNEENSPAAQVADIFLPLCAGPELSVAATKSFIVSCVAGAAITGHWLDDSKLLSAIAVLPEVLARATEIEWPQLLTAAAEARSLYVLGRGPSFPIAQETALKLKETCGIHAEAFSTAEVLHGPWELMERGFPVLAYSPDDRARALNKSALDAMRETGAAIMPVDGTVLPYAASGNSLLDPLSMIQTGYLTIERIARARRRDPDRPRLLKKVTETI